MERDIGGVIEFEIARLFRVHHALRDDNFRESEQLSAQNGDHREEEFLNQ